MVTTAQLHRLGLDRFAITRRAAAGLLHPLHRGVYAVGHPRVSLRGRCLAAVMACGSQAALSHRSAARLWDLRAHSGRIEVTVQRGRVGPQGVAVHRSRILERRDVTSIDGIRVTTVARTLLDLAAVVSPRDLARVLDRAERLELFDLTAIDDVLDSARGRRGAAALRAATAAWRPRHTRSELEDRYLDLLALHGIQMPLVNVLLDGEQTTHEVDCYWPSHRLVVRLDSYRFHRTRADHERDAATDADLELAGYRVVRLTWDEVTLHAERTARRMRSLLSSSVGGMRR